MNKKQARESKSGVDSHWIMGKHAARELLKRAPQRILKGVTSLALSDPLIKDLEKQGVAVKKLHKDDLTSIVESDSHQGILLKVKERRPFDLVKFLRDKKQQPKQLILALDSIMDPQNFGAILRCAEVFGVAAVVWSKNRGCEVTPVVSKTSVGASELVPLIAVSNLAEGLEVCAEEGYTIIAASADEGAQTLGESVFPDHAVLVMGSEGEGIRPIIKKKAAHCLKIPMFGQIESLNVSQAAAVLLSHWRIT